VKRGGQGISINGAASHLAKINDRIIIVAYGIMELNQEIFQNVGHQE